MESAVAFTASPATMLHSMRGVIIDARIAHPDILHLEVRDARGDRWRLATQDAEWSPTDPIELIGRSIRQAEIDEKSGRLRFELSDGTKLDIQPALAEARSDPPAWELLSPDGLALEFGPGVRWQISAADAVPSR